MIVLEICPQASLPHCLYGSQLIPFNTGAPPAQPATTYAVAQAVASVEEQDSEPEPEPEPELAPEPDADPELEPDAEPEPDAEDSIDPTKKLSGVTLPAMPTSGENDGLATTSSSSPVTSVHTPPAGLWHVYHRPADAPVCNASSTVSSYAPCSPVELVLLHTRLVTELTVGAVVEQAVLPVMQVRPADHSQLNVSALLPVW